MNRNNRPPSLSLAPDFARIGNSAVSENNLTEKMEQLRKEREVKFSPPPTNRKTMYTMDEALAEGLNIRHDPPDPIACQYCGKMLNPLGLRLQNTIIVWHPGNERCDCEEAAAYWEEYDAGLQQREEEKRAKEKQDLHNAYISSLIGGSRMKKRFQTRTFENFEVSDINMKAYEVAKDYADNFEQFARAGVGIYFEGSYGTGKTHLAAAICMQLLQQGKRCICQTSIDMMSDIKSTFDPDSIVSEGDMLKRYKTAALLVVDDLGKENPTDWSTATLYDILNARYEDLLPTVITTNYNTSALVDRLTPKGKENTNIAAMMSRIKGTSRLVTMVWDDQRLIR